MRIEKSYSVMKRIHAFIIVSIPSHEDIKKRYLRRPGVAIGLTKDQVQGFDGPGRCCLASLWFNVILVIFIGPCLEISPIYRNLHNHLDQI